MDELKPVMWARWLARRRPWPSSSPGAPARVLGGFHRDLLLVIGQVVRECDLLAVRFACRHLGRRHAVEESDKLWLFEDSSHCLVAQRTRRSHLTILAELVQLTRYGRKVQLIQRHQLGEDSSNNHIMKWAIISDAIYISDDEGKRRHKRQRAKKTRGRAPCSEPCLCERTLTRDCSSQVRLNSYA
ncbi:uncharacterized protein [Aegilops tauschii subsp. strangulata]|uniref:uncharacterized protein n=1 Tax=Aegilops tauschii subsp. strangulata TaxID=200361 RepID=UPI001ABC955E|nr:uncharacterized protein LOC109736495 [Aegilops tauschii subsp. strangulata]XP_044418388.1 uncharacterized protein LOC123143514 isoform X2 [Triticum aestivum]